MKFDMICARRLGKLVPRWQLGSLPATRGTLLLREEHDHELNRCTRCARFIVDGGSPGTPVPTLFDAVLVCASYDVWVLSGIERVPGDSGDERGFAQTWLLSPIDHGKLTPTKG